MLCAHAEDSTDTASGGYGPLLTPSSDEPGACAQHHHSGRPSAPFLLAQIGFKGGGKQDAGAESHGDVTLEGWNTMELGIDISQRCRLPRWRQGRRFIDEGNEGARHQRPGVAELDGNHRLDFKKIRGGIAVWSRTEGGVVLEGNTGEAGDRVLSLFGKGLVHLIQAGRDGVVVVEWAGSASKAMAARPKYAEQSTGFKAAFRKISNSLPAGVGGSRRSSHALKATRVNRKNGVPKIINWINQRWGKLYHVANFSLAFLALSARKYSKSSDRG